MRETIEYALGGMSSADKMVLSRLNENGMAWIVGGWVRDSLLGGNPDDMDIATTLTPEPVSYTHLTLPTTMLV